MKMGRINGDVADQILAVPTTSGSSFSSPMCRFYK